MLSSIFPIQQNKLTFLCSNIFKKWNIVISNTCMQYILYNFLGHAAAFAKGAGTTGHMWVGARAKANVGKEIGRKAGEQPKDWGSWRKQGGCGGEEWLDKGKRGSGGFRGGGTPTSPPPCVSSSGCCLHPSGWQHASSPSASKLPATVTTTALPRPGRQLSTWPHCTVCVHVRTHTLPLSSAAHTRWNTQR